MKIFVFIYTIVLLVSYASAHCGENNCGGCPKDSCDELGACVWEPQDSRPDPEGTRGRCSSLAAKTVPTEAPTNLRRGSCGTFGDKQGCDGSTQCTWLPIDDRPDQTEGTCVTSRTSPDVTPSSETRAPLTRSPTIPPTNKQGQPVRCRDRKKTFRLGKKKKTNCRHLTRRNKKKYCNRRIRGGRKFGWQLCPKSCGECEGKWLEEHVKSLEARNEDTNRDISEGRGDDAKEATEDADFISSFVGQDANEAKSRIEETYQEKYHVHICFEGSFDDMECLTRNADDTRVKLMTGDDNIVEEAIIG